MATYDSLGPSDKAIVDNTVNLIRSAIGELGQGWNHLRAIIDDTNAISLVTSIDAGGTIPNTSGLAGADDLTRSELVTLYNLLKTIRDANDTPTNRAAMSKAAGINALLG